MRIVALTLLMGLLVPAWTLDVSLSSGYRRDYFTWSIGTESIDILSELQWKDLEIWQAQADLQHRLMGRWWLDCLAGGGVIFSGRDQDSDYYEDGRRFEFSRSYARVNGYVMDLSLGVGRPLTCRKAPTLCIVPRVGAAWNRQYVRSFDAVQVLNSLTFPDGRVYIWDECRPIGECGEVTATYRSDWATLWSGLALYDQLSASWHWDFSAQIHGGVFLGKGDWKLRAFDAFYHAAPATGLRGQLRLIWCPPRGKASLNAALEGSYWITGEGTETIYEDGESRNGPRFNEANWRSVALSIGVCQRF